MTIPLRRNLGAITLKSQEEEGSVTRCIGDLKEGRGVEEAVRVLWTRYYVPLVKEAQKRRRNAPPGMADEEDAALNTLDTFCRGVAAGDYPELIKREELWRLLVTITARKVCNQIAYETAGIRDQRRRVDEGALDGPHGETDSCRGLDQIPGRDPSPAFIASTAEECKRLLNLLKDDTLRRIAVMAMDGYLNHEIARSLNCSLTTIERKMRTIRETWELEVFA